MQPDQETLRLLTVMLSVLGFLATGVWGVGVLFLKELAHSVKELNYNIGVLLTRVDSHEEKIDDHEERIRHVELS